MQDSNQSAQATSVPQNFPQTAAPTGAPPVPAPGSPGVKAREQSVVRIAGFTLAVVLGAVAVWFFSRVVHYRWAHLVTQDSVVEGHFAKPARQHGPRDLLR